MACVDEIFDTLNHEIQKDDSPFTDWLVRFFDFDNLVVSLDFIESPLKRIELIGHTAEGLKNTEVYVTCNLTNSTLTVHSPDFVYPIVLVDGHSSDNIFRAVAAMFLCVQLKRYPLIKRHFTPSVSTMKDGFESGVDVWANFLVKWKVKEALFSFPFMLTYPHPRLPQKFGVFVKFALKDNSLPKEKGILLNRLCDIFPLLNEKAADAFFEGVSDEVKPVLL